MDISGSTIMRISSIISRHGEGQISTDQAATILANFNTARDNISSATQSPAAQLVDHYYAVSAIGDTEIFRAISIAENSTSSIRHSTVALLEAVAASTADTVQPDSVAKQVRDTPQI